MALFLSQTLRMRKRGCADDDNYFTAEDSTKAAARCTIAGGAA
jgi:hypothetical protein